MSDSSLPGRLLEIGAVSLSLDNPFTWASGMRSPIYCDNRLTLSYPDLRSHIAESLAGVINLMSPAPDSIVGVATAGIPHAALVADRLELPLAYVRSAAKKHGRGNQIEGRISEGDRVVVIEDLISTGGSSLAAAEVLREAGLEVLAVLGLFSYQFDVAVERFREAHIPLLTLTNLEGLLLAAETTHLLSVDQVESLREWRKDPMEWSARNSF